jgi:hypothetical protein
VQDESASLSPEQAVAYTQLKSEKVLYNYNNSAIFLSLALANKAIIATSLSTVFLLSVWLAEALPVWRGEGIGPNPR